MIFSKCNKAEGGEDWADSVKKELSAAKHQEEEAKTSVNKKIGKLHFGWSRVLLALSCAAVAVVAIVYFVNLNMPDISLLGILSRIDPLPASCPTPETYPVIRRTLHRLSSDE